MLRRSLLTFAIAVALLAPALPAAAARAPIYEHIGTNFLTGAHFYFRTIGGWIDDLLGLLGLKRELPITQNGEPCTSVTRCAPGLVCQNTCADGQACDRYEKRCLPASHAVTVLGTYSACGANDLCADGTFCTRTCPAGLDCGATTYRCMPPVDLTASCQADADCVASCASQPLPPIGPSGYVARCSQGSCHCDPIEVKPSAARIACPPGLPKNLVCPTGTWAACTPSTTCSSGDCPPVLTCLTAPDYGGTCLADAGCAQSTCPEGATPFCADNQRCECRVEQVTPVSCQSVSDCAQVGCAVGEVAACVNGACACAPAGPSTTCTTAADCADCAQGYTSACQNNSCVCQKTENVPVACQTLADCGAVACPGGYDKACLNNLCSCTRQVPQP